MYDLKIGDIVTRKSYGGDIPFRIVDIINKPGSKPIYVLRGILYRIGADSFGDDLIKQSPSRVYLDVQQDLSRIKMQAYRKIISKDIFLLNRARVRPGRILHIDSSKELMDMCIKHYKEAKLEYVTKLISEDKQPYIVRRLLEQYRPDILVVTGHDSLKKGADKTLLESYSNSKYYIQSVKEARKYEADHDKLCVFAGACQSYFEKIMEAGADFASSPKRILINGLDPALVSEKVALTDNRKYVTPEEISEIIVSGPGGIGGIKTRGRMSYA